MRDHTPREQALFEEHMAVLRRWAERVEGSPATQQLWRRAHADTRAALAMKRQDAFYRAFLVEPDGDVPHHLTDDTVWGYFRNDMRVPPSVFYDKATDEWETALTPRLPGDWYRATVDPLTGAVEPEIVRHPTVPGSYNMVSDKAVQAFLGASGGRAVPLDEIPDPYGVLRFPDFSVEVTVGSRTRSNTELVPITLGGKPPLTYTLEADPDGAAVLLAGNSFIVVASTTQEGVHTARIGVADSLGAKAEAIVTITGVAAPNP